MVSTVASACGNLVRMRSRRSASRGTNHNGACSAWSTAPQQSAGNWEGEEGRLYGDRKHLLDDPFRVGHVIHEAGYDDVVKLRSPARS